LFSQGNQPVEKVPIKDPLTTVSRHPRAPQSPIEVLESLRLARQGIASKSEVDTLHDAQGRCRGHNGKPRF